MNSRFVDVPAAAIRDRLAAAGFHLVPRRTGDGVGAYPQEEEVYERAHDQDARYTVKVYSSIRRGEIRECGADAIRVIALLTVASGKTYPIFKGSRVYRTGTVEGVLDRMIERARVAYARCNEHRKERRANAQK